MVTLVCALGLAGSFLAIVCSYVPFIQKPAVLFSVPGVLAGALGMALAFLGNTRLTLPALTLLVAAVPAARDNWHKMQTVWVESKEVCAPPGYMGGGLVGLLATAAMELDHDDIVGGQICGKLGKSYADYECDGPIGRIKCEPP